jgi:hypothetical protein
MSDGSGFRSSYVLQAFYVHRDDLHFKNVSVTVVKLQYVQVCEQSRSLLSALFCFIL